MSVSSLADDLVLRHRTQRSAKEEASIVLQTVTIFNVYLTLPEDLAVFTLNFGSYSQDFMS